MHLYHYVLLVGKQFAYSIFSLSEGGRYPAIGNGAVAAALQSTSTTAMSLLSSQKQKSFGAGFDYSDSIPARNAGTRQSFNYPKQGLESHGGYGFCCPLGPGPNFIALLSTQICLAWIFLP